MISRFRNYFKKTAIGKLFWRKRLITRAKGVIKQFKGEQFVSDEALINDLVDLTMNTTFKMEEYFLYNFSEKTTEERNAFASDKERIIFSEKVNPVEYRQVFNDKVMTYKYFKDFYKRKICYIHNDFQKDLKEFSEFLKTAKDKFIVKTLDGSFGKGVKIYTVNENDTPSDLLKSIYAEYNCNLIIEEVIKQSPEMAKFHPSSVNTVRMPTICYNDSTKVIHPFFRVGRGNSVVDNAGAGGIICAVDVDTGLIIAAADEFGKKYEVHPETKQQLVGFKIPYWNEAVEFAKELAQVLPDNVYSAWDSALTANGWGMVEGNYRGQFVWQIPTQVGFKKELELILQQISHKGDNI